MPEISMLGLALQGFSTGLGVVFAQWFFKKYFEPKMDQLHDNKGKIFEGIQKVSENMTKGLN